MTARVGVVDVPSVGHRDDGRGDGAVDRRGLRGDLVPASTTSPGHTFTLFQRLTLLAFFGMVLWLLYRMGDGPRHGVRGRLCGAQRVQVRYRYAWTDVKALRFRPGDPWLQLFDADGNRLGILAVQASEGSRAGRAAKELAAVGPLPRRRLDADPESWWCARRPGFRTTRSSPVMNASGGQVIGSTASPTRPSAFAV